MSRLIDADDYLYRERPVGLSDEAYKESHLYKSVMEQEVIKAIPLDRIERAREEMENEVFESLDDDGSDWFAADKVSECMAIIDKLIAESEIDGMSDLDGLKRQMEECIENAFNKGYKKGIADRTIHNDTFVEKMHEAYDKGLHDTWESIKKIVLNPNKGGFSIEVLENIFGEDCFRMAVIIDKFTVQEVIARITEYEAEKERNAENHVDWHEVSADDMTEAQLRRAVKDLRKEIEELKYGRAD